MKTEFGMMGLSFWEAPARMEIRRGLTLICPLNSPIGHRFDPALPALGAWDGIDMVPGRGAWVVRIELTGDTAGMAYRAYPVMTPEEHIALARRSRRFSKGDITDALLDHLTSVRQEAEDCYRHRLGKRTWYGMCAHEWCPGQADPDSHGVRGGGFYCAMHANPSMPQTQDPRDFVPVVDLAQVMGLAPRRPIY